MIRSEIVCVEFIFNLMYYVKDTARYKSPNDILAWDTLVELVQKADLKLKIIKKGQSNFRDREVYPE